MKQVLVTISQASDGSYWCHTEEDVFGSGLNAVGTTVREAKDDLMLCLDEARKDFIEAGGVPEELEFVYKYDLQSFFEYFSFLNVSDIARRAGISPSLMRQYVCGSKKAGEKTYGKLSTCLSGIRNELAAASF